MKKKGSIFKEKMHGIQDLPNPSLGSKGTALEIFLLQEVPRSKVIHYKHVNMARPAVSPASQKFLHKELNFRTYLPPFL